jgi:Na+/H+ antiporter NhaD/arsenite permease-like protein
MERMTQPVDLLATSVLGAAILHTFSVGRIRTFEKKMKEGTLGAGILHYLAEVEVVFGLWAGVFIAALAFLTGPDLAIAYLENVDFTEAVFVFAVMAVAATRPIQALAAGGIELTSNGLARLFPKLGAPRAFFIIALVLGPLLGSLITEPAAMTVCALLLRDRFFEAGVTERFRYKTLGLLFVNISIGGLLTHFAAPPVVMVAQAWQWDTPYLFSHFGWKAIIAVIVNTAVTVYLLRDEFLELNLSSAKPKSKLQGSPFWLTGLHLLFLFLIVYAGHHIAPVLGLFLFFMGMTTITAKHQDRIQIRESLLVGFFLAGIIVLGERQSWWISPLISSLTEYPLYFGATALTALTDNAALTYLGAQVPSLSESLKYALVAGAVVGGGLTVIANAPNPAGYAILKDSFGESGIRPGRLFLAALIPTAIASFFLKVL